MKWMAILLLAFACGCQRQERVIAVPKREAFDDSGKPWPSIADGDHIIRPYIGKRVQVDGLAWGATDKGLGEHLVSPSGTRYYLSGKEYLANHPQGKLVRIVGTLSIKTQPAAPKGSQGYSEEFHYYAIEVESVLPLEKAENDWPSAVGSGGQ